MCLTNFCTVLVELQVNVRCSRVWRVRLFSPEIKNKTNSQR